MADTRTQPPASEIITPQLSDRAQAELDALREARAGLPVNTLVGAAGGLMSKCTSCGEIYPRAPKGYIHKCGRCSGGICEPITIPASEGLVTDAIEKRAREILERHNEGNDCPSSWGDGKWWLSLARDELEGETLVGYLRGKLKRASHSPSGKVPMPRKAIEEIIAALQAQPAADVEGLVEKAARAIHREVSMLAGDEDAWRNHIPEALAALLSTAVIRGGE